VRDINSLKKVLNMSRDMPNLFFRLEVGPTPDGKSMRDGEYGTEHRAICTMFKTMAARRGSK
jgi:hypothetical protein